MAFRPLDEAKFAIERWLVRGPLHRVLLAALLVGLISIAGGALVLWLGSGFIRFSEAVWWSFLRLSDPGYLGDDAGVVNRVVSTSLTVLGYVVFLGALVAIMTQWLNARMEKLESGLTPVVRDGHVLILGWTNRTDAIVRELLLSQERARRFLDRRGGHSLHIVLLAEHVTAAFVQNLRDAVGPAWDERRVTIRSGSALRPEHLRRVDASHASVILIPGAAFDEGSAQSDAETIKTLLSLEVMSKEEDERPRVVAEIYEAKKVSLARRAYRSEIEVVSSDVVISRLLAQNIRHPGMSHVYDEILTHDEGNEVYIRDPDGCVGLEVAELRSRFDEGVLMGLVRGSVRGGFTPLLNPPGATLVREDDKLVVLAQTYAKAKPSDTASGERAPDAKHSPKELEPSQVESKRILLLGWNHRVPALLSEFSTYDDHSFDIRIASKVPAARRHELLEHLDASSLTVEHLEVDFTDPDNIDVLAPERADSVVFMGSDWMESEEETDARTLIGSLIVDERLRTFDSQPTVILELLDPDNAGLVHRTRGEIIISPLVLSHLMTHVGLRPELKSVFDELLRVGGAELMFRAAAEYGAGEPLTFDALHRAGAAFGETVIGVRDPSTRRILLNPGRQVSCDPADGLEVISVVTTAAAEEATLKDRR